MKLFFKASFRRKLFVTLLFVALIPLLVCTLLLLQFTKLRTEESARSSAQAQLSASQNALNALFQSYVAAGDALRANATVSVALADAENATPQQVYAQLYAATAGLRTYAQFDLYDAGGIWRYSTVGAALDPALPTNWGVLYAAAEAAGAMVFRSVGSPDASGALLRAASAITLPDGSVCGYFVASMTASHFEALFAGGYEAQNALILLDARWNSIYASRTGFEESVVPALRAELFAGQALSGGSDASAYYAQAVPASGFYLVLQQPRVFTRDMMTLLYSMSGLIALVCVVCCIFIALKLSKQFFDPIQTLQVAMSEVETGRLDTHVELARVDELGKLAASFNRMVERLNGYLISLVARQRELNETQIRMMQAQLNPHFLGNTLDTIKWMARMHDAPEIANIATNLADILRLSISVEEFVPLHKEIELLNRYIDIQRIRFPEKLNFVVTVGAGLETRMIPKLILQPLVENAVLHGLAESESGSVCVDIREAGAHLVEFSVSDDGCGIPEETLRRFRKEGITREAGHLGLYNVDSILRKFYGEAHGLRVENLPGRGARVTASLPLDKSGEVTC